MLELRIVSFRLHQTALLNVHHLTETIQTHTYKSQQTQCIYTYCNGEDRREEEMSLLTHVELSNEARHIVVFKVLWQNFLGKASLVKHMETSPSLKQRIVRNVELVNNISDHISYNVETGSIYSQDRLYTILYQYTIVHTVPPVTTFTVIRNLKSNMYKSSSSVRPLQTN